MATDLPTLVHDLVGREEIPGTGKMPKELDDLVRSNYLYLHSSRVLKNAVFAPEFSGGRW